MNPTQLTLDQILGYYQFLKSIDSPGPKVTEAITKLEEIIGATIATFTFGTTNPKETN